MNETYFVYEFMSGETFIQLVADNEIQAREKAFSKVSTDTLKLIRVIECFRTTPEQETNTEVKKAFTEFLKNVRLEDK